jgi:hypothetical protein
VTVMATHSNRQFPLHFPARASKYAITFQLDSTWFYRRNVTKPEFSRRLARSIYFRSRIIQSGLSETICIPTTVFGAVKSGPSVLLGSELWDTHSGPFTPTQGERRCYKAGWERKSFLLHPPPKWLNCCAVAGTRNLKKMPCFCDRHAV